MRSIVYVVSRSFPIGLATFGAVWLFSSGNAINGIFMVAVIIYMAWLVALENTSTARGRPPRTLATGGRPV